MKFFKPSFALMAILLMTFALTSPVQAQEETPDSAELAVFMTTCIKPIIQKDRFQLEKVIQFPLEGDWGYQMELGKPEVLWTKNDFFEHYEVLFDDAFLTDLQSKEADDIEVYEEEYKPVQLLVSHFWETAEGPAGVVLRFKKIEGVWKLYVVEKAE